MRALIQRVKTAQVIMDGRTVAEDDVSEGGVDAVPGDIHGMAAHVADLAVAEIPIHVPLQAVRPGSAGEIAGIVGMEGRWPKPQVEVETGWRLALGGQISGAADLAVARLPW